MSWTNYHSHCHYCDGTDQPDEYAKAALKQGFIAYGFSSHSPVPFETSWNMKMEDLNAYFLEVKHLRNSYRKKLQIYCGLEVDFVPGVVGPHSEFVQEMHLDYTVGSVHFVDAFSDGRRWEVDGSHTVFLRGLEQIFGGDIRAAVSRYYELTRQMVTEECPDIVGHLDKIKMQNAATFLFGEDEAWYQDEVLKTLDVIAASPAIVEINTRGLYKSKTTDVYPSRWIVEEMFRRNIPVTISSDAHHPKEIGSYFDYAAQLLKEVGYQKVHILLDDSWQSVNFDEKGIRVKSASRV